jgi:hypothetical protein
MARQKRRPPRRQCSFAADHPKDIPPNYYRCNKYRVWADHRPGKRNWPGPVELSICLHCQRQRESQAAIVAVRARIVHHDNVTPIRRKA